MLPKNYSKRFIPAAFPYTMGGGGVNDKEGAINVKGRENGGIPSAGFAVRPCGVFRSLFITFMFAVYFMRQVSSRL
jgi:hypothetical protein